MTRPDPGRGLLEERVTAMAPEERAKVADRMRHEAFLLAWSAADEASIEDELDRAMFILARLYPEMPPRHVEAIRAGLERKRFAGTWHGFQRPSRASPGPA